MLFKKIFSSANRNTRNSFFFLFRPFSFSWRSKTMTLGKLLSSLGFRQHACRLTPAGSYFFFPVAQCTYVKTDCTSVTFPVHDTSCPIIILVSPLLSHLSSRNSAPNNLFFTNFNPTPENTCLTVRAFLVYNYIKSELTYFTCFRRIFFLK